MQKLDPNTDGKTMDIVADNVAKLKELFPEIVTEGKVDFEVLKEVLGEYIEDREERYSFTWNGKSKARMLAQTPSNGTLRPCPEESVNFDSTQNLFIEGDNLEVLKLLQKSYYGKVKMIYIDPPYNTGGNFIYPDDFHESIKNYLEMTGQVDSKGKKYSTSYEMNGRYHTDWLNMMYPRLRLARNLLKNDGVIFVSIDDNEVSNVRKICDEVFGEENFIATIIWQKVYSPKNTAKHLSEDHDYIVLYAKNANEWTPKILPRTEEQNKAFKNPDNDPRGPWKASDLSARNYYSKGTYSIACPSGRIIDGPPSGTYWRFSKDKFQELDKDNRIWWGKDGNNAPAIKRFLSEVKEGRVPQTMWFYQEVGHNQEAKKELIKRVNFASSDTVFDTPKPTRLIEQMLKVATNANDSDVVLDFFAGSATTGDAVYKRNVEGGGNRRFILVQLPELTGAEDYKTIAEISKARLRSASKFYSDKIQDAGEGAKGRFPGMFHEQADVDLGFKVFKLDSTNIKPWDADFDNYESSLDDYITNIKPHRTEEDVLYEILLKYGLDLALPIEERTIAGKKVFIVGSGALVLCLANGITLEVVEGIADLKKEFFEDADKPESKIMRVVFKDNGFSGADGDVVKTNAIQILRQHGITDVKSL